MAIAKLSLRASFGQPVFSYPIYPLRPDELRGLLENMLTYVLFLYLISPLHPVQCSRNSCFTTCYLMDCCMKSSRESARFRKLQSGFLTLWPQIPICLWFFRTSTQVGEWSSSMILALDSKSFARGRGFVINHLIEPNQRLILAPTGSIPALPLFC